MEFSTDIAAKEAIDNNLRKKETKQNAEEFLKSEEVRSNLIRTVEDGGSVGRRLSREIKRFESTGRISNWLATQTTKAELNVGRQRQQAFSELVSSVAQAIDTPVNLPFGGLTKFKPEIQSDNIAQNYPWDIYIVESFENGYIVKVRAGTISNMLPDNWDDEFSISNTLNYGIVTVFTDGLQINGAEISFETEGPEIKIEKNALPDESKIVFGLIQNGRVFNVLKTSPFIIPRVSLITTKDPPAQVGESPYDFWFQFGQR